MLEISRRIVYDNEEYVEYRGVNMDAGQNMNILVTLDAHYILPLRVLLHSLVTADPDASYTVYVAHASLCEADFAQIRDGLPQDRCAVCPIEVPGEMLADAPVLRRLSKATYYRLVAASYLPKQVDRILYLDPDITVLRPIRPFYELDLQGRTFAAASHVEGFYHWLNLRRLKIRYNPEYVNAGVLLMDVARLRAMDNTEKIFDFVRRNARRLLLGDQDVINALYDGDILCVDARLFNLDEKIFSRMRRREDMDLQWVRDHAVIVHYDGSKKPWDLPYDGALGEFFFDCRRDLETQVGGEL